PGSGRRDGPSLFEKPRGLVEASEVAELACEASLARRRGDGEVGDELELFGAVPGCALSVAFDRRDHREVHGGAPGGVAGHLAQVTRPRLGKGPRLVEAAEHREQRRARVVLGTWRPP